MNDFLDVLKMNEGGWGLTKLKRWHLKQSQTIQPIFITLLYFLM